MLSSMLCCYEHFLTPWYKLWRERMYLPAAIHRKRWEWCAIAEALWERDMLRHGRSGCGFAVGKEPLVSLFASLGARVMATDAPPGEGSARWAASNQHAVSLDDLHRPRILSRDMFLANASFQYVDMRNSTSFPSERFDFIWSSCAFEHLGTLEAGHTFVLKSAEKLLKPGGIAVHTTEFNVSSEDETIASGVGVLYRRKDIDDLAASLRKYRCGMVPFNYDAGRSPEDLKYDYPPYGTHGNLHIKLLLHNYVATSALIIIVKA